MQPVSLQLMPNNYRVNAIGQNRTFGKRRMSEDEYALYNDPQARAQYNVRLRNDLALQQDRFEHAYAESSKIANLSNRELRDISNAYAAKDNKYSSGFYKTALLGIPALDVFARTTAQSGTLSEKGAFAAKAAGGWLGVFALAGAYNIVLDKASQVSPQLRDFADKHPVISSIMHIAGFFAVLKGAQKVVDAVKVGAPSILPKTGKFSAQNISGVAKSIGSKLDKSSLNTKVVTPAMAKLAKGAKSHPQAAGVISAVLYGGAFIWAIGALFKAVTQKSETAQKSDEIYTELAKAREANRAIIEKVDSGEIQSPAVRAANRMAAKIQSRMDEIREAAQKEAASKAEIKDDADFAQEAADAIIERADKIDRKIEIEKAKIEEQIKEAFEADKTDAPDEARAAKIAEAEAEEISENTDDAEVKAEDEETSENEEAA